MTVVLGALRDGVAQVAGSVGPASRCQHKIGGQQPGSTPLGRPAGHHWRLGDAGGLVKAAVVGRHDGVQVGQRLLHEGVQQRPWPGRGCQPPPSRGPGLRRAAPAPASGRPRAPRTRLEDRRERRVGVTRRAGVGAARTHQSEASSYVPPPWSSAVGSPTPPRYTGWNALRQGEQKPCQTVERSGAASSRSSATKPEAVSPGTATTSACRSTRSRAPGRPARRHERVVIVVTQVGQHRLDGDLTGPGGPSGRWRAGSGSSAARSRPSSPGRPREVERARPGAHQPRSRACWTRSSEASSQVVSIE